MPTFHKYARWFKENFQHESYRSWWDIQLFFTGQVLEMIGSWVIDSQSHALCIKTLSENLT